MSDISFIGVVINPSFSIDWRLVGAAVMVQASLNFLIPVEYTVLCWGHASMVFSLD